MDFSTQESELIDLALMDFPSDRDDREVFSAAIKDALRAANAPNWNLDDAALNKLLGKLAEIRERGVTYFDIACVVSLAHIKRQVGWRPCILPSVTPLINKKSDAECYNLIRNALGILSLAWQVMAHPDNIITTAEELERHDQKLN